MSPVPDLATRGLVILIGVVVASVAGFFLWVVGQRIGYPYELEWMEGAMADHVARVLDGKPIYTAPTHEHVAFLYHPGFFYAAGFVGLFTGPGFLALRITSVLATLCSCFFVYRLIRRDGSVLGGWIGIGVFLASFSAAGCYYDIGRIDPLFTCLLLAGIERTRAAKTCRGLAVACFVFLLAWLTKQTALVILPIVVLGLMPGGFWRAVSFGIAIAATCGAVEWILDVVHDGWMSYYTLELPRKHGVLDEFLTAYWTHDVLPYAGAMLLFVGYLLAKSERRPRKHFHGAWIFGCVLGSFLSRLHIGGAANVLIPMIAGMSVACGLGFAARPGPLTSLLAVSQIVLLFLLPFFGRAVPTVPSPVLRGNADRLKAEIASESGAVFVPWHGYLATLAGKQPTAHAMAMDDVWRSGNVEVIEMLNTALRDRLSSEPFPVIYIDDVNHAQLRDLLLGNSYAPDPAFHEIELPQPVGSPLWPRVVMRR